MPAKHRLQTCARGGNGADAGRRFYFVSPDRLEKFNGAIKSIK
ncbi:hypothetical protein [Aureibacter tunicatorum]|uniref:Uncharacterized protein n=1 Tax=Aureibacter tunicatorum TaxID=866807 RepID=A0AAE4BSW6_9BACT|nr:hypothetical protein [Aureibacter tunicatorum]MDR6239320.1 hypothetical protein [Aureibacter tunicatorum]